MTRRVIAGLIVVGLGAGIWLLWPRADSPGPTSTTRSIAVGTTSTSSDSSVPTTVSPSSSSTTSSTSHVVATLEEAEAILRELWFGWFEGIYNQDEDRIREVVATEEQVADAAAQFGAMEFSTAPTRGALEFSTSEILRSDSDCLAVWTEVSATFREGSSVGVHVIRRHAAKWVFAGYWAYREDLWETDCETLLGS